jgi:hypothetical protein
MVLSITKIELKRPKKREIGSKTKKCDIYEYKQEIHKEFNKQNIYKELDILHEITKQTNYDTQYLTKKLNHIDHKVTKIVLKAEKKNGTRKHDNEWSVALHQQSLLCRYWSIIKKGMKNGRETRNQTTKLYKKMSKNNQENLDKIIGNASAFKLNQLAPKERKRNIAIKQELVRHHAELRAKGMKQLAEIKLREGDEPGAKIIHQISKAEESK